MASSTRTSSLLLLKNHKNNLLIFSLNSKKPSPLHPFPSLSSLSFSLSLSSSLSPYTTSSIKRVTIAPVEYAPPAPDSNNFQQEISCLKTLRLKLSASKTLKQKLKVLNSDSKVKHYLNTQGFERVLGSLGLGLNKLFLVKCLVSAGQEHVIEMGFGFGERKGDGVRSSVKTALYALVEMIEKWDANNGGDGGREGSVNSQNGSILVDEESEDLKKLLNILGEIEQFYDCIGGIVG
ncbi:hypothetical protein CRYUN_Cryun05aG0146200 [Craigia yunnanensis]